MMYDLQWNRLFPSFTPDEFACKCSYEDCPRHGMQPYFVASIQLLRLDVGIPFILNSAFRCEKHNRDIKGAKRSYHLAGLAVDISTEGITGEKLHRLWSAALENMNGVIIYKNFIHIDGRSKELRHAAVGF